MNELDQTENYNWEWTASKTQKTTTSASPHLPQPAVTNALTESAQRPITADTVTPLKSDQEAAEGRSTTVQPPEVTASSEKRGRADFSSKTPTANQPSVTTSSSDSYNDAKTDGIKVETPKDSQGDISTITPTVSGMKAPKGFPDITIPNTVASNAEDTNSLTSPSFVQSETDQTPVYQTSSDGSRGLPEVQTKSSPSQPSSSSEAVLRSPTSPSMPHFSSTMTSVLSSGVLLQATQSLSNGERTSVFPSSSSSSSFASSLLCDTLDPSAAPSSCLHDPVLSASALDSQHSANTQLFSKDLASPLVPTLSASTLLPPSPSLSASETDSVHAGLGFGDRGSNGDLLFGSTGPTVFSDTPALQTVLEPTATAVTAEIPESSWDLSLSEISLSLSPTLLPSVVLSRDITYSDSTLGLSASFSDVLKDLRYAKGSTVESVLPEFSGDTFPLASDVDIMCACSMELSVSSSWLHASPHAPLPSSAWDYSSTSELYSSVGHHSASSADTGSPLPSLSVAGSGGLSLDQPLFSPSLSSQYQFIPSTNSDLHVSVAATASTSTMDSWLSAERNTVVQASSLPPSPTASPLAPASEGQVIDSSSSASGSALFPDSQEGLDQDWDRVQTSASGESVLSLSTTVSSTAPPFTTSDPGQSQDDLDDRSSAFYFESGSGSGSVITPEVGGSAAPDVSEVTSASAWSLGGAEESGSGQGESLYDNETSSDFSISERTERGSEEEEAVAGKKEKKDWKNFDIQNITNSLQQNYTPSSL